MASGQHKASLSHCGFMQNVSFARNSTPVAIELASFTLLLNLLLEHLLAMRLFNLAIYRLKVKVNTIIFKAKQN